MFEKFEHNEMLTIESVIDMSKDCDNNGHFQQVAYSVHANCLTAICFDCKKIFSNYTNT